MNGVRIGEASHPGPIRSRMIRDSCDITIAVTNIVALFFAKWIMFTN